jgi:hypothetical protein
VTWTVVIAIAIAIAISRHTNNQYGRHLFRGTCSKKHWAANLKYAKTAVDLEELDLSDVDAADGLELPHDFFKSTRETSGLIQS